MSSHNLFAAIPEALPHELIETLLASGGMKIERIVSLGHSSPPGFWYDQPQHEWVVLLAGAAVVHFENESPISLCPGDFLDIPPHRRHRVESTDPYAPTIWLAVHFGVVINSESE